MSSFIRRIAMLSGLSLFILNVQADDPTSPARLALVIGNAAYAERSLKNPVNDAKDMAKVLEGLGFQVILKTDVDLNTMIDALRAYGNQLSDGGVGLFYFAGHGIQYKNLNYLVPIDTNTSNLVDDESVIKRQTLGVDEVLSRMEGNNKKGVNIIILDACRNNLFGERGFRGATSGGLAEMRAPTGSLIAYATAPNTIAKDNPKGLNGMYTKHLLAVLREMPQESILDLFTEVTRRVVIETSESQVPWKADSLRGKFCLAARGCERVATQPPVEVTESTPSQLPTAVCPDTPAGVAVDKDGCPLDSDHDGVPDYLDKCPDTPPNTKVDKDGCPTLGANEEVSIELEVLFDANAVVVKPMYFDNIKRVADFMRLYANTTADIEGHTDSEGSAYLNKKLSQRRADAVREVLISRFGIEPSRLRAIGYGKDRPVADNKTEAGRQENRRVVAVVRAMVQKQLQPERSLSPLLSEPETTPPKLPPLPRERPELTIVDQMTIVDQQRLKQVLEEKPDGQKVAWKNPNTGNEFEVTPTKSVCLSEYEETPIKIFGTSWTSQSVCRDYEIVTIIRGQRLVFYGTACRQPDGSWKSVK